MKKAIVMMMLLSLSGCVPFYMPPSNGEVATLTVPVIRLKWGSGGATLIGVAGDNGCGKLQRIRKEKNKEETSLKVPSDRAIFISFMQQYSDRICGVSGWASLEAGENYEAGFNFESRNRCFFFHSQNIERGRSADLCEAASIAWRRNVAANLLSE